MWHCVFRKELFQKNLIRQHSIKKHPGHSREWCTPMVAAVWTEKKNAWLRCEMPSTHSLDMYRYTTAKHPYCTPRHALRPETVHLCVSFRHSSWHRMQSFQCMHRRAAHEENIGQKEHHMEPNHWHLQHTKAVKCQNLAAI